MKKRILPFSIGFAVTALLLALWCGALAAGGTVSYNFANVALNGETKITAGEDITAANGQRVPGTILYTDAAGGKTNYLPIRAVSELLGVEIGYDSASRTVLLTHWTASAEPPSLPEGEAVAGRQWLREPIAEHGGIFYRGPGRAAGTEPVSDFPWHITWLPEGWTLDSANSREEGFAVGEFSYPVSDWYFRKGEGQLAFHCYPRSDGRIGQWLGQATGTKGPLEASVQGRSADFYQDGDQAALIWEDGDGNLFWLDGPLSQTELERIAASVTSAAMDLPEYQVGWLPDETARAFHEDLPGLCMNSWNTSHLSLHCSAGYPLTPPGGRPESVTVRGAAAKFWAGDPDAVGIDGASYSPKQLSTLMWTDMETGVCFRLQGVLEKDAMLRVAESVVRK